MIHKIKTAKISLKFFFLFGKYFLREAMFYVLQFDVSNVWMHAPRPSQHQKFISQMKLGRTFVKHIFH